MWFEHHGADACGGASDPARLTLPELIATRPRHRRGPIAPGERYPTGARPGRRRAQGVDLDSIGPYVPGDDLRSMDWRATARTGRAQMKRFIAESHLARMIIVDMRAHMFFATTHRPMAKTAALFAAELVWEAHSLHEPVGLLVMPEAQSVRPRRGRGQMLRLLDYLVASYARLSSRESHASSLAAADAVEHAGGLLRRGDEICLLSDFGEDDRSLAEVAAGLAPLRCLRAVVIEDAIFSEPVPRGRYPVQRGEAPGRDVAVVSSKTAHRHRQAVDSIRCETRTRLESVGWRVARVTHGAYA